MHFMLVWNAVEGTKKAALLKETFYPSSFEFIFTPEQFCNVFFFFFKWDFHIKSCEIYILCIIQEHRVTYQCCPKSCCSKQDLWTLVAFYEISRKRRKIASACFLLNILIPAFKW